MGGQGQDRRRRHRLLAADADARAPARAARDRGLPRRDRRRRHRALADRRAGDAPGPAVPRRGQPPRRGPRARGLPDRPPQAWAGDRVVRAGLGRADPERDHRGAERAAGRRLHVRAGLARDAPPGRHVRRLERAGRWRGQPVQRALRLHQPLPAPRRCLPALHAPLRRDPRGDGLAGHEQPRQRSAQRVGLLLRDADVRRRLPRGAHDLGADLPLRLRHPGRGLRGTGADHRRARPRPAEAARLRRRVGAAHRARARRT